MVKYGLMISNVGLNIRKIRELKNYSQDYVSDKLSISQSSYSDIENNKVNISEERLEEISKILQVSTDTIKNFDEKVVFNSCNQSGNYNTYYIDQIEKIEGLYKELIETKDNRINDLLTVLEEKNKLIETLKQSK